MLGEGAFYLKSYGQYAKLFYNSSNKYIFVQIIICLYYIRNYKAEVIHD